MTIYVQQRLYQIDASFYGPWANSFTLPLQVVKDQARVTLLISPFSATVTTPSLIFAQLPGDLYPFIQTDGFSFDEVSWSCLGIANNVGVSITICINSAGLLKIGNGVANFSNGTNTFTAGNSGFEAQALTYVLASAQP